MINLLLTKCKISKIVKSEILSLPINPVENFVFSNEYKIPKPSEQVVHEINIQNELAKKSNNPPIGYPQLKQRLKNLKPSTLVYMRFIESETWGGRVFESDGYLQGVLLGRKESNPMKTPPNWDGSLKMLKEYSKLE